LSEVKKLGKFEILSKVGQGAMGVVYKARDPLINRVVALKTLKAGLFEDAVALKRFYSEARSAGNLRHPNIVTIYELGHEGDIPFIAMQFLSGESLDKVIDRLPNLPLSQRVGFVVHTCRALDYAHRQNPPVIHRDIKPANVVVGTDGSVVVVDFGIARLGEASVSLSSGFLIGTLGYMSPQLFHGAAADAQSDIWATGVMFYELLAYRRPFRGDSAAALMSNVVLEEPRPISEAAPGTPEDVQKILTRMLAKNVEERYQSMEEVLTDLEPVWKRLLQTDMSILLENSERLLNEGDLLAAKSEIVQILNWDSTNVQAKRVSDLINSELRKQKLVPQVRIHVEKAQKLLAQGQHEEARSEAQLALKLDSSYEPAAEVVRQAQLALERSRKIRDALLTSEELLAQGSLTEAETQLDQALSLDPCNESARDHLKQVREERTRRELRKQRDTLLQQARSLWTNLKYEDCVSLLVSLSQQFPDDPEILKFLDAARQDQAEQRRQTLLVGIRDLLSAGQFTEALQALETFFQQFPSDPTAYSLQTQAVNGRDVQKQEQRVSEGKNQLRVLLSQKNYEETVALGKELQSEFPWDSDVTDLLITARIEQTQLQQRLHLEQLIGEIQEMVKDGRFADAIRAAETALSEFPANTEILNLAARAKNEQAEKGKQQLLKQRVREVERMLTRHQLTDAIDLARQSLTALGEDSRLAAVLHQAEKELEFREQKRLQQAEMIQAAHSLLNDGKLTDAALLLKDAIESKLFSSEDPKIRALFEEIAARRRPATDPGSERKIPAQVSEITLFPAAADSARDYVLLGGTSSPDASAYTEKAEEAGANSAPAASVKPSPSSSAPNTDPQPLASRVLPLSSQVETGTGAKENLNLKTIEKHLAVSVGPIARFIVEKAAAKAKNQDELFAQIASTISSPRDREVFLSKRKQFVCAAPPEVQTANAAAGAGPSTDTSVPRTGSALNPADIGKAAELAARYLGPISRVLAERAARHADSLRSLYMILAGHLKENERAQFLHDAGYPES
jgi:serine/threonine protein kinase